MTYDRSINVDITRLEARKSAKGVSKCEYPTVTSSSYTGSTPAAEKMRRRLERVRTKQQEDMAEARRLDISQGQLRRLRGKQRLGVEWLGDGWSRQCGGTCSEVEEAKEC